MNENEVKNNTNENNAVTPGEPVVAEGTVSVSTPEVTLINEPEMANNEPAITTSVADVTPIVETAVVQENVVSEITPVVEESPVVEPATSVEVNESPAASITTDTVPVEEHSTEPQVNVSVVSENADNGENVKKKSKIGLIIIVIAVVAMLLVVVGLVLNKGKEEPSTNGTNNNGAVDKPNETPNNNGTLIEDVIISGYMCMGENCTILAGVKDSENDVSYNYNGENIEFVKSLNDYSDYIKVNIYVTGEGENITIVNYELFNKSTNTKIDGVTTEEQLRTVLGMYNIGTHTAEFTLVEIGMVGAGFGDNEESYTYIEYEFVDEKGFEYEMKYINPGIESNALVEGNKYTVTFEITEGTFDYEYTIKEIK